MSNLQEDYLLRLLRPFVAAIAQILFFKKQRDTKAALDAINTTSEKLLGLNASLMSLLSERYLLDLLEKDTDFGALRCLVLAALLKEEADVYLMMGDEDAGILRYLKALKIYLDILSERNLPEVGDHIRNMEEIADHLRGFDVPDDLRERLALFFERKNRFAQAEDLLYDRLDQAGDDNSSVIENGIFFYERLLTLHPARLASGGLPLEEVQQGLAVLQAMQQEKDDREES